ncbi:hypothetical protein [Winogradskya humida]|uniref:Uncharacterized protein n=1 Tax=Winogradskya humida TaxID=113566 RepID=A0ABQ3ZG85_9ACTN|nr:hypothetical protein [Actinoplanes humidus]GIE17580.1 hypothetical protein Ahu01nite_006820 [Actinoplanes humidus]
MGSVPVFLELPTHPQPDELDPAEGIAVTDMEDFSTANKCNCAASDDNPY